MTPSIYLLYNQSVFFYYNKSDLFSHQVYLKYNL